MRRRLFFALATILLGGPSARADGPDVPLAVIVHADTVNRPLTAAELASIFLATMQTWPNGTTVIPFNYPAERPLRVLFDDAVLHMSASEVGKYWVDQRVRGAGRPPRVASDPSLIVRLVAKLPGAIGYVPANLVDTTVRVVARVANGKVLPP